MAEVLEKLHQQKPVLPVADGIKADQIADANGIPDPHIWFDVELWLDVSQFISEKLSEIYPDKADTFRNNAKSYQDSLKKLHEETRSKIASIPKERRVLITAHDAFGYFGKAYDIEVKGLQGISTLSEFGIKDVKDLVDFIVTRKIKAVFVETSIPKKSLEAVVRGCQQRGHKIKIGGTLFSDAMGEADSPEGTYIGMVQTNVNTIVNALK